MNEAQVRAAELLAQEYDYGNGSLHAHKVAALATSILDQLGFQKLVAEPSLDDRRTLTAAAYAHCIGASPFAQEERARLPQWAKAYASPDRDGEVSFLLLRTRMDRSPSDRPLATLTAAERSLLLYCILWHDSATPYVPDVEPLFDREKTLLLAGILRVADGLDCDRRLRVKDVRIQAASAWIRLLVDASTTATAEVARAQQNSDVLGNALGLRVFVQEVIRT